MASFREPLRTLLDLFLLRMRRRWRIRHQSQYTTMHAHTIRVHDFLSNYHPNAQHLFMFSIYSKLTHAIYVQLPMDPYYLIYFCFA